MRPRATIDNDDFGQLLRTYRTARGLGTRTLAAAIPADRSHLERLEAGTHCHPGRDLIDGIARALALSPLEHNRLMLAAGLAPGPLRALGWEPALADVAGVLLDRSLSADEIEDFRTVIRLLAGRMLGRGAVGMGERRAS